MPFRVENGLHLFQYVQLPETGGWLWVLKQISVRAPCLTLEKFEMKKSLIALAVLAASGASMAQSTVTLYGIADLWFGSVKSEAAGQSLTQTKLDSGGVNGSRWGMKGSEDLGGGLKANFDFQQGISLDTGAGTSTAATAFSRQSWVGVSGGFGAVRLGRTTTPFDDVAGASHAVFDSALSPTVRVFATSAYVGRYNNMMYYQAPDMGGFSGAIAYGLGEDKTATTSASSNMDFNLTYAAGPLSLQFAYQTLDIANTVALPNDKKFMVLGAKYAFGPATLKANYGKADNIGNAANFDATDLQIGVDYAVSPALTVSASYAKSDDNKTAGQFESARKGFGLAAAYTLSKRTFVYGGFESDSATVANTSDTKTTVFAVGMQHRF
jgi:predicted porin